MTYDVRCEELARFFLEDSDALWDEIDLKTLAEDIQRTVEDYIAALSRKKEAK